MRTKHIINILILLLYFNVTTVIASARDSVLNDKALVALDKKDYSNAIILLEQVRSVSPDNKAYKNNLLLAYNNFAIELAEKNQLSDACKYIELGFKISPDNKEISKNLVHLYLKKGLFDYSIKEYSQSKIDFSRVLTIDNSNLTALIMMGKVFYLQQDLTIAEKYWKDALKVDPKNSELHTLISSIQKENATEDNYSQLQGDVFDIRFDYNVIHEEVYDLKQYLMDCYREVGQDFNYFPKHKIVVLLYKESEFRSLRDVPGQVSGLFDGKIRIPVNYKKYSFQEIKTVLRHEFTHAVIYDLVGNACPIWINEGLAVYEEKTDGQIEDDIFKKMEKTNRQISISDLNNPLLWRNTSTAPIAYSYSYLIVNYMIKRWNFYLINQMLYQFRSGKSFENILINETNCSLNELENNWKIQQLKK